MYRHPVIRKEEMKPWRSRAGIFKPGEEDAEKAFVLEQGGTDEGKVTTDIEQFLKDLKASEEMRVKLGIPPMTYHAYSFPMDYNPKGVRQLMTYIRTLNQEIRVWHNEQSGKLIVCIADPDTSVDSGFVLWEYMHTPPKIGYDAYGLASWYEFVVYGVPVPDEWTFLERGDKLFIESPDKTQIVYF